MLKAQRATEAKLAALQRVGESRSGDVKALTAALSSAQQEAVQRTSALSALERELTDRDESIVSLKAIVEDLQRSIAPGPAGNPSGGIGANQAEAGRGGTKE